MNEAWIALAAAVFGGAGLKGIESLMSRSKDKADIATQIRDELRTELASLREELREVTNRLDKSREMYYTVLHALNLAKGYLMGMGEVDKVRQLEEYIDSRSRRAPEEDE